MVQLLSTVAGPGGGGGGVTDHGALTGLGDHDHSIYGRLAVAETWALLQTFTLGVRVNGSPYLGVNVAPQSDAFGVFRSASGLNKFAAVIADVGGTSGPATNTAHGMIGRAMGSHASNTASSGLDYLAGSVGVTLNNSKGVRAQIFHFKTGGAGGATDSYDYFAATPLAFFTPVMTNHWAFYAEARKFATLRGGLHVDDPTLLMGGGDSAYGVQIDKFDADADGTQWPFFYGDIGTLVMGIDRLGVPFLPTFTVAGLPASVTAGKIAFATDGRKTGQGAGAGTGVLVYDDGTAWLRVDDGTAVVA